MNKKQKIRIALTAVCLLIIIAMLLSIFGSAIFAVEHNNDVEVSLDNSLESLLISEKPIITSNNNEDYSIDGDYIFNQWTNFQENYPNRKFGTDGEKLAADYLASEMEKYNLTPYNDNFLNDYTLFVNNDNTTAGTLQTFYNVVGEKKANVETKKTVIIMGHYDNDGVKDEVGKDSSGSGASAVTVLALAKALSDFDLPYNVVFCLTSCKYLHNGVVKFYKSFSKTELDNILLIANIDSPIIGDNIYLYADELPRSHEDIFFEKDKNLNNDVLTRMPKKINYGFGSTTGKNFLHRALLSDIPPFTNAEVNSISIFGYNLSPKNYVVDTESDTKVKIQGTAHDTVKFVSKTYGEDLIKLRFSSVSSSIFNSLLDENFEKVMLDSKTHNPVNNFFYSNTINLIVLGSAFGLFLIFFIFEYLKEKKHAVSAEKAVIHADSPSELKSKIEELMKQNGKNEQDINNDEDDDDDIFDLKK